MGVPEPGVSVMASVVVAEGAAVRASARPDERELYVVFDSDPISFELLLSRDVAQRCVAQFSEALREMAPVT
ncbi:hypothetical protein [Saccharothrix algeriensis]|uniref:Uncharacterized protein n=1 Tax=Saccharothrix algeriensis TaxID=173560 RepID=A0A8T8HT55_9PSEU|nr:hypothetical protein [Saccharothrix algeriensis]MBM7813075.1 hypothetical protein [Saccharothrix algeriensis]QTR01676.1 hypothetical protein J7S33_20395 [Saccharothrix algeriensis]